MIRFLRRLGTFALLLACWSPGLAGAEPTNTLIFPTHGFSIAPLEGRADDQTVQPVIMMLPPVNGFAGNVNVMVQPYGDSLDAYIALSEGQFAGMKWKVVKRSKTATSATWEYTGNSAGRALHWYARALWVEGKVYLVTATAAKAQWADQAAALRACVDSFTLTPSQP